MFYGALMFSHYFPSYVVNAYMQTFPLLRISQTNNKHDTLRFCPKINLFYVHIYISHTLRLKIVYCTQLLSTVVVRMNIVLYCMNYKENKTS